MLLEKLEYIYQLQLPGKAFFRRSVQIRGSPLRPRQERRIGREGVRATLLLHQEMDGGVQFSGQRTIGADRPGWCRRSPQIHGHKLLTGLHLVPDHQDGPERKEDDPRPVHSDLHTDTKVYRGVQAQGSKDGRGDHDQI